MRPPRWCPLASEIEFDLAVDDPAIPWSFVPRAERLVLIGRDLYAAGLTTTPIQEDYHANQGSPTTAADGWRFEEDYSVDGEIISPILRLTPQAVRAISRVVEIVKRYGGIATPRAGFHIHRAVGVLGKAVGPRRPAARDRLLRFVRDRRDPLGPRSRVPLEVDLKYVVRSSQIFDSLIEALFRVGTNPKADQHRGSDYANPFWSPAAGDESGDESGAKAVIEGRQSYDALSYSAVNYRSSGHDEVRVPDASLHPGVMQALIKLFIGLALASLRGDLPVMGPSPPVAPLGRFHDPLARRPARIDGWRVFDLETRIEADRLAQLLGTAFHRRVDMLQVAALFVLNPWVDGSHPRMNVPQPRTEGLPTRVDAGPRPPAELALLLADTARWAGVSYPREVTVRLSELAQVVDRLPDHLTAQEGYTRSLLPSDHADAALTEHDLRELYAALETALAAVPTAERPRWLMDRLGAGRERWQRFRIDQRTISEWRQEAADPQVAPGIDSIPGGHWLTDASQPDGDAPAQAQLWPHLEGMVTVAGRLSADGRRLGGWTAGEIADWLDRMYPVGWPGFRGVLLLLVPGPGSGRRHAGTGGTAAFERQLRSALAELGRQEGVLAGTFGRANATADDIKLRGAWGGTSQWTWYPPGVRPSRPVGPSLAGAGRRLGHGIVPRVEPDIAAEAAPMPWPEGRALPEETLRRLREFRFDSIVDGGAPASTGPVEDASGQARTAGTDGGGARDGFAEQSTGAPAPQTTTTAPPAGADRPVDAGTGEQVAGAGAATVWGGWGEVSPGALVDPSLGGTGKEPLTTIDVVVGWGGRSMTNTVHGRLVDGSEDRFRGVDAQSGRELAEYRRTPAGEWLTSIRVPGVEGGLVFGRYAGAHSFVGVHPDTGEDVSEFWRSRWGGWQPRLRGGAAGAAGADSSEPRQVPAAGSGTAGAVSGGGAGLAGLAVPAGGSGSVVTSGVAPTFPPNAVALFADGAYAARLPGDRGKSPEVADAGGGWREVAVADPQTPGFDPLSSFAVHADGRVRLSAGGAFVVVPANEWVLVGEGLWHAGTRSLIHIDGRVSTVGKSLAGHMKKRPPKRVVQRTETGVSYGDLSIPLQYEAEQVDESHRNLPVDLLPEELRGYAIDPLAEESAGQPSEAVGVPVRGGGQGPAGGVRFADSFSGERPGVIAAAAKAILADLRTARRPVADLAADGLLGPDVYDLRRALEAPMHLAGIDQATIATDQLASFFRALDMTLPSAPVNEDLRPETLPHRKETAWKERLPVDRRSWSPDRDRLAADLRDLPEEIEMPLLYHSIWLGSALTGTRGFWANLADLARRRGPWEVVLWTDIPRATFTQAAKPPPPSGSDPLRDVREMMDWAKDNHIWLVNVDEVFHADAPMRLNDQYRMELAKYLGLGWGAGSDILRFKILDRFGGIYTDSDNTFVDASSLEGLFRKLGFAVHYDAVGFNISALLAARGHPFVRLYLDQLELNYASRQTELLGADRPEDRTRAANAIWLWPALRARRNSVMERTGPENLRRVAVRAGYRDVSALPRLTNFTMGAANSWLPDGSPLEPARRFSADEVPKVTRGVVSTLIRELYNRDGDLHLTYVAPVIAGLPDPDAAWRAVIEFILGEPSLASRIRTVTDRLSAARRRGGPNVGAAGRLADRRPRGTRAGRPGARRGSPRQLAARRAGAPVPEPSSRRSCGGRAGLPAGCALECRTRRRGRRGPGGGGRGVGAGVGGGGCVAVGGGEAVVVVGWGE